MKLAIGSGLLILEKNWLLANFPTHHTSLPQPKLFSILARYMPFSALRPAIGKFIMCAD
jgi:hypothetical protein